MINNCYLQAVALLLCLSPSVVYFDLSMCAIVALVVGDFEDILSGPRATPQGAHTQQTNVSTDCTQQEMTGHRCGCILGHC